MNKKVALSLLSATVFASMAASAFAAPKAGVYMGGEVDRYYALTDLFKLNDQGLTKFQSDLTKAGFDNIVFVDTDKKGAFLKDFLTSNEDYEKIKRDLKQSDFEGAYTQANIDGTDGESYDPRNDITPEPVGELKVESVSAINAKDILVDFDVKLDKLTAEDEANYVVKVNNGTALATTAYTVTVDATDSSKATIVLNDASALKTGDSVSVTVKKTVLNEGLKGLAEDTTKTFSFVDTAAPTIDKVEVSGSDLKVTFNEYVSKVGLVKVDGASLTALELDTINTALAGAKSKTITLAGKATGLAAGNHTIVVGNAEDIQPTANVATFLSKDFTVTVDTVAPTVGTVEVVNSTTFKVTFDKEVKKPTVSVSKNGFALNAVVNETGPAKEYTVTVSDNGGVLLYNTGENTANLAVKVTGYQATSNNLVGNPVDKTVTLTKDAVAPTVDTRFSQIANIGVAPAVDEVFNVQFSEELKSAPADVDASKIVLKDKDGVRQTVTSATVVNDANSKKTILQVKSTAVQTTGSINAGTYTIELSTGAVKDLAGNANATSSVSFTKAGAPVAEIDLDPNDKDPGNPNDVTAATDTITIKYGTDMADSATILSNYKIDNAALPAGTLIYFTGDKKTVEIKLPTGSIAKTADVLFSISGTVASTTGAKVKAEDQNIVLTGLKDNVKPVLTGAKKVDKNTVVLTFSEAIDTITDQASSRDDFGVKVNGLTLDVTAIANGTNANEVKLTVADYNVDQEVVVTVADANIEVVDKENNTAVTGTTVTATK